MSREPGVGYIVMHRGGPRPLRLYKRGPRIILLAPPTGSACSMFDTREAAQLAIEWTIRVAQVTKERQRALGKSNEFVIWRVEKATIENG